jgi:hypothetical protein
MKVLKVIGLVILSIILFFSLTLTGFAFMVDRTVMNPDFVSSEFDRLDISGLAGDALSQQSTTEFSPEMIDMLKDTIAGIEPDIKSEFDTAVHYFYDYLKGEREDFELTALLRSTFLSSDFLGSVIDETDIAVLAKSMFLEQIMAEMPLEEDARIQMSVYLEESLENREPYLKEELKKAVDPAADYLTGQRENFSVSISLEPLLDDFETALRETYREYPPAEMEGIPPEQFDQQFDVFYQDFVQGVPSAFEIDETVIGADAPAELENLAAETETALEQSKEAVGQFQLAYILIIVISVLLIGCIVLIHRSVRGSTRNLGPVFLASGLLLLAVVLIRKFVITDQLVQQMQDVPEQLQVWVPQMLNNLMMPLQWLSIGFIIAGIALIVISFVYRPRETAE